MNDWKELNICTIFWLVAALCLGLGAYVSVAEAAGSIVGILLALATIALVGFGATRYFCTGSSSEGGVGLSSLTPAAGSKTPDVAAAAAKAAQQNVTTDTPPPAKAVGATTPAKTAAPKSASPPKAEKTKAAAAPEPAAGAEGTRPTTLDGPRGGKADNLKEIKGIGPKLEKLCHSMGFYHFDQIAGWTADEVAWVDANLEGFKGRVTRDNWIDQAKTLAAGGETEFSKRVGDGDVY